MQYNLPRINESSVDEYYDAFGNDSKRMPLSALTAKFEETDMGPDEDSYNEFARGTISDFRPDPTSLESDAPRGGVNARYGRIELQYYGDRSSQEPATHAEIFQDFIGSDMADPRRYTDEPDFNNFTAQEKARMRYIRFSKDDTQNITGAGRSEGKLMQDQQSLFRVTRDRLKVFTRQKEGRVEGVRKSWRHCSDKINQELSQVSQRVGDNVADHLWVPQRKTNIIAKIMDVRALRCDGDQDCDVQRYTQNGRKRTVKNSSKPIQMIAQDGELVESDPSVNYKAVGILMDQVVRCRTTMQKTVAQDIDYDDAINTQARKHEAISRDLATVLREILVQNHWSKSDETMAGKNPMPQLRDHLANVISLNHLLPAQHYLNAELMYKSVKAGSDMQKVRENMVRDNARADIADVKSLFTKSAKLRSIIGGKNKDRSEMIVDGKSEETHNYKLAKMVNGDRRIRQVDIDQVKGASDLSKFGRNKSSNYRNPGIADSEQGIEYYNNDHIERHGGRLGHKDNARYQSSRDMAEGDIAAMS